MPNKKKIVIASGILIFLLICLLIVFSLKKRSQSVVPSNSPSKVVLEEKLDSPEIGLSLDYPKSFKVVMNDSENFALVDESNSAVKINIQKIKQQNTNGNTNSNLNGNPNSNPNPNPNPNSNPNPNPNPNSNPIDIYSLINSFKQSFLKIDKNAKFLNETKFIKNQNDNAEKFPGMGFEVQYSLNGTATKYFLATIQKGLDFYVFSLSAPLDVYSSKIGVITSMLGTLNLKK